MKKKIIIGIVIVIVVFILGCFAYFNMKIGNKNIFDDYQNTFKYAVVNVPGKGYIEGKVKNWKDYANEETIMITFEDGTCIITSYNNAVLFRKEPSESIYK